MANYSLWALGESEISVSGGEQLDGVTQGDGSHLVGETITLNSNSWEQIDVRDRGSDTDLDDNDSNQKLDGAQTFDGVSYSNNTVIEAEFEFTLLDPSTGLTYRVLAININNSSPSYGTIEGLAFVGTFPPTGVALQVVSTQEGPTGGTAVDFVDIAAPPCFTLGTMILTPDGERPVESLKVGDLVETQQHGPQPLRWKGVCEVSPQQLETTPSFTPVRISKDAFGQGFPNRDMLVSQQHRVLVEGWRSELLLGQGEVLAAAAHLVNGSSVSLAHDVRSVTYLHLLFDDHEIVFSDGLTTESFNPGPISVGAIPMASRMELANLFPEVDLNSVSPLPPACHMAKKWEAELLGSTIH
ncbi:Hint domain-containing protein [Shimia gijangensis]|uniref:Hint domain-containing protein n=1 Tax=Shimia gijangensis TaxID=1470563 RepID=A0A1M6EC89_9RHOB|nr:Hint domain-containing protein [Shimia gijangensis]SHI83127.1 Hint domain-containing protein [Shimia gijangensis]